MDSYSILTIICPTCQAELDPSVNQCPQCGGETQAGSAASTSSIDRRARLLERPWMLTIVLLHLGLFGIPLYWRMGYSRSTRIWIVGISIAYTLFVAVVVVWGTTQIWKAMQALG